MFSAGSGLHPAPSAIQSNIQSFVLTKCPNSKTVLVGSSLKCTLKRSKCPKSQARKAILLLSPDWKSFDHSSSKLEINNISSMGLWRFPSRKEQKSGDCALSHARGSLVYSLKTQPRCSFFQKSGRQTGNTSSNRRIVLFQRRSTARRTAHSRKTQCQSVLSPSPNVVSTPGPLHRPHFLRRWSLRASEIREARFLQHVDGA